MNAQFLDPLDVRLVDDSGGRPKWELLRPFTFFSAVLGREIIVGQSFVTDGPSVPSMLVPVLALQGAAQATGFRAAVIHDWLLQFPTVTREQADRVFLEALRVCGVDESVASTMYNAVRTYSLSLQNRGGDIPPGMAA